MDAIKLKDGGDLLKRLLNYNNRIHILAGHVHRAISGNAQGIGYTMFKSTAHQMPLTFDTDDPSISIREPGAYGIVLINGSEIIVHTEDFTLPPMTPITGKDALPD